MRNKIYAGIGSRETPPDVLLNLSAIAASLSKRGFILRSGGADGADLAFEWGCDSRNGKKEIYLPWKGFNGSKSLLFKSTNPDAENIAKRIHPAWDRCSIGARKLHTRNVLQILGQNLDSPVGFVICWTKLGQATGGTATAINLALENNIPVFNFGLTNKLSEFYDFLKLNVV